MTKAALYNTRRRQIVLTLIVSIAFSALYYAYLLNQTISNGIRIERGDKQLSTLNTEVSTLEQQYFQAKNKVTLSFAKELGYADSDKTLYVSRSSQKNISLRNEK